MPEIDHLFICTTPGAPGAAQLTQAGLIEGTGNRHAGQGTANRRFFFRNAMLELLWIEDQAAARSTPATPLRLWQRQPGGSACPFGVCLRAAPGEPARAPFAAFEYRPAFLPPAMSIQVARDAPPSEPLWFFMHPAGRPDAPDRRGHEPLDHPLGLAQLTGVRLSFPGAATPSLAARAAACVRLEPGDGYAMELEFDNHAQGKRADLRPELPLLMSW